MRRIAWATDIHLDSVEKEAYEALIAEIKGQQPDLLLLSGDIANGRIVISCLESLKKDLGIPIYFVLGNHDYYGTGIELQRGRVHDACGEGLTYLNYAEPISLDNGWALIGHDGWADGKEGSFFNSTVGLNDYVYIDDLAGTSPERRFAKLNMLGEEAAAYLRQQLEKAFVDHKKVILVTHVPPYRQACCYHGAPSDDNWAPHFVCQSVGTMLLDVMSKNPDKEALVLCGHCHHEADVSPLENLRVIAGHAVYGAPQAQDPILLEEQ